MSRQINRSSNSHGFTIVEMLVVAPIVLLAIGAFITAIVGMTGEVLATRAANSLAYNIQDALGRIEADIKLSTTYLATNSFDITSPQGLNNDSTAFDNATLEGDALILNSLVTTGNPTSTSSGIVYLDDKPNDCAINPSPRLSENTPMTMNIVYFVKDGALWRRTVMPADYATAGCNTPWQRPSCAPGQAAAFCKTQDMKLVENVDPADFRVEYFSDASSTTVNTVATNHTASDASRYAAMQTTTTIGVSLDIIQKVAGREINQNGSIRATKLDTNASTLAPIIPEIVPAAPTVTAKLNPSAPTTAVFSWESVPGATSYTINYNVDAGGSGTYVNGATNAQILSYNVQGSHGKTVCATVYANSSVGTSPFGSKCITVPLWQSFTYYNSWNNYGGGYATGGYTKTSAGIVVLKGMMKKASAITAGETIAILPPGYRPAEQYMFGTNSGEAASRIDIFPDGRIAASVANNAWLSLEGITFIPSGSQYTWTAFNPLYNSWVNYGNSWATAGYTRDIHGRVFTKGLIAGGATADGTTMAILPDGYRPPDYLHILTTSNNTYDFTGFSSGGGVLAKGRALNGYRSIQHRFYANGYATWSALPLSNSWSAYGSGYAAPQYTKAPDGLVTVKGLIAGGATASGTVIGTLPAGYRPKEVVLTGSVCVGGFCRLDVYPNGQILARAGVSATWTALDNITFYAEQ